MPSPRASLSRAAARILEFGIHALPPATLLGLAEGLGSLWFRHSRERRDVVLENLRIAFGEPQDPKQRARLGEASCRALARVVAESAVADRLLGSKGGARRRLRFEGDWAALRADAQEGRGGLIVTGHIGNWEVGAWGVRHQGIPVRVMARRMDSDVLEFWLTRQRGGSEVVIRKAGGLADLVRSLRAGRWVALLADQNAGRHGVFVPFFGLRASTFPTPAALAVRLDVPIYLGVCLRRPGREAAFDIHLERLEPPSPALERGERVGLLLAGLTEALERWIRKAPAQYNWAHRRWKTRPFDPATDPDAPSYGRRQAPPRQGVIQS